MKCAKFGQADKTEQEEHRKKLRSGYVTTAHQTDVLKLQDELHSNAMTGLTSSAYSAALAKYGANALTPQKHDGPFVLWLKSTFSGFFNILLLFGSVLCFLGFGLDSSEDTNLYLGIVLFAVVIITGTFSWYQDSAARAIMEGFKNMLPQRVSVVREGTPHQERPESLVPGDLIALRTGDSVPADVRIVSCSNDMQVDNSAMTGESEPQDRAVACTSDLPAETKNLAFFGTKVLRGDCTALVINTGDRTMMGRIAALVDSTDNEQTPIKLEIKHFIKIITIVAVSLGVLFFLIGIVIGRAWIENMVFMIGIIVANVPEGLLATVTIGLAVTAHRMGKKNVLVKNLEAVETLGSTSVICSDKTGTLTMNVMTMANVWYDYTAFDIDVRDPMKGTFNVKDASMTALMTVGCLCNNVVKETVSSAGTENKTVALRGDASEQGIAKFLDPHFGGHFESTREENSKLFGIPFNSANKWQLSVHQLSTKLSNSNVFSGNTGRNGPLLVFKGAPEVVVDFCDRILHNGKETSLDAKARGEIASGVQKLGNQGKRVLGFAMTRLDETIYGPDYKYAGTTRADTNLPLRQQAGDGGLVFVGLMAMVDPYRPGVPEAVATCQTAGVKVIMVTGDHPVTATAIARQVGIIQPHHLTVEEVAAKQGIPVADVHDEEVEAVVVQGHELTKITECPTDEQIQFWNKTLNKPGVVFARTSPQQKLLIVEACQARGGIVAVTGDGVNDAPALKKANIGVAMGIAGTQVAKDAADMIIMDDNFATIVVGIEEGRIIFDNLKKSISYTLSSNIPELMPFLVYILIGIPLPLSTVLILCVDLGTDMLPAISFAYEPKEADIMRRLPRDPTKDRLVTPQLISFAYLQIGVIQAIAGFYAYLVVMTGEGFPMASLPGLASSGDYGKKVLYACVDRFPTCTYGAGKEYDALEMQSICGAAGLDGRVNSGRGYFQAHEQDLILRTAQTAFFVSIVISQWADLLICKTRYLSLLSQGLTNEVMIAGLIEETLLCVFLSYTPGVQDVLGTAALKLEYWTPTVPFTILIYVYDELRKWWIRRHKGGWLDRNTAW